MKVTVKLPDGRRKIVTCAHPNMSVKAALNSVSELKGTQFQISMRREGQDSHLEYGTLAHVVCQDGDLLTATPEIAGGEEFPLLAAALKPVPQRDFWQSELA